MAASPPPLPPDPKAPTINIGAEFGTAKRNLPPAKIVLLAIAGVLIVVAFATVQKRARPQAAGSLDNIAAVEIPGQNSTMVALTFTLNNTSDKTFYVRTLQSSIKAPSGDATVDPVSGVDFERYFQAFPTLKENSQPPLSPEDKVQPGEKVRRTIIVAYPITLAAFHLRQSTSVIIWPYNETVPVILTQ